MAVSDSGGSIRHVTADLLRTISYEKGRAMMMLLLPPVALVALVAWLRTGRWIAAAVLLAIGVAYAVALTLLSSDPYFEDNGSVEFIAWRYRLVLALEVAGWLTPFTLPLVLLVRAAVVRLRSGTRR